MRRKILQEIFTGCDILSIVKMLNLTYFDENTQNTYTFEVSEEEAKKLVKVRIV